MHRFSMKRSCHWNSGDTTVGWTVATMPATCNIVTSKKDWVSKARDGIDRGLTSIDLHRTGNGLNR